MLQWIKRATTPKASRVTLPHHILGSVTLCRSPRARRISISVRPTGEVRLTLPLKGRESTALTFLENKMEWVIAARTRIAQRPTPQPLTKEEVEELRRRAKAYLPQRIATLAQQHGIHYNKLSIRATRSKWGSCTAENNISLSLFLMQLPHHLIDFVILHELCHTIHHNHSQEFHKAVDRLTEGSEKTLQRELKGYSCGVRATPLLSV